MMVNIITIVITIVVILIIETNYKSVCIDIKK